MKERARREYFAEQGQHLFITKKIEERDRARDIKPDKVRKKKVASSQPIETHIYRKLRTRGERSPESDSESSKSTPSALINDPPDRIPGYKAAPALPSSSHQRFPLALISRQDIG
jgi:hypothetical protein